MHGKELGRANLGGARLGLVRHGDGQETPRHAHAHACLHIVLRGVYVEHSSVQTVVACAGDVVFKEPEVEHWNDFGSTGAESLRFELPGSETVGLCELEPSDAAGLQRALQLGRALRAVSGAREPTRLWIRPETELLVRLRRDFRSRLDLGALAGELGVHRSHLTRQFTRAFGCSPQTYVALKRTAWAAEELTRSGDTLAAIAAEAGFADQSHCTRTFKRVFGATPSHWSRRARW
jgi:AraC-like DNA-binding protein